MSFCVQFLIRLRYMVVILLVGGHINNFVRHAGIFRIGFIDLTVRRLHKTVLINTRIACQ